MSSPAGTEAARAKLSPAELRLAGGYQKREYWKQPFVRDGRTVPWEEAVALFHDATGRYPTERYLGCKQELRHAVNDNLGLEDC